MGQNNGGPFVLDIDLATGHCRQFPVQCAHAEAPTAPAPVEMPSTPRETAPEPATLP
jgi:hypothetical protein